LRPRGKIIGIQQYKKGIIFLYSKFIRKTYKYYYSKFIFLLEIQIYKYMLSFFSDL